MAESESKAKALAWASFEKEVICAVLKVKCHAAVTMRWPGFAPDRVKPAVRNGQTIICCQP